MKFPKKFVSNSEDDTRKIAQTFSEHIKNNSILYIEGDVGVGKTFFARSVAKNFGISNISSSTYSFVSIYSGKLNLIHCDLYRYDDTPQVLVEEIFEQLIEPWLLIIEWPNFVIPVSSCFSYKISISNSNEHKKVINISTLIY